MTYKAFKYRLYPTKEQENLFVQHFGHCRYIYNWGLNQKLEQYQKHGKSDSCIDLINKMVQLKKQKDTEWLKDVNSQSLQMSLRNLDNAFTRFFRKKTKFPKFKNKRGNQSFQCPQDCLIDFDNQLLSIPKFRNKNKIKVRIDRKFEGKIKTVTVSKNKSGKYFAAVLVEIPEELPSKPMVIADRTIGIDLGLKDFATLSTGEKISNPRNLKKSLDKIKYLHYKLSKTKKRSKRREKAKIRLAKAYEKISNQRNDFLHKLSYKLTHDNQVDTICMEDLNVRGMMKNYRLAQSISDVSWSRFVELLKYKCDWYGKNLYQIGRFEPSSKMCSCGKLNNDLKLRDREWTCQNCGATHDRDILAAQNIKRFGLIRLNSVPWESGKHSKTTLVKTA